MAAASAIESLHHDIELTTRRLELEKRRLHRLEHDLDAARSAHKAKTEQQRLPQTARREPSSGRRGMLMLTARPRSSSARSSPRRKPSCPPALESERSLSSSTPISAERTLRGPREATVSCKTLVSRLEVQLRKLDGIKSENVALRAEVDALRRQRLQLNGIFDKLKVEIKQHTARLAEFVEETQAGQEVQNSTKVKLAFVKRQQEQDRSKFKQKVLKLREDLAKTSHNRKEVEVQLKHATEGVQKKKELIVPLEEQGFSEDYMMRRIMKAAFLNCIQRRHIKQHQKNIEVFEQAFSTIKCSTGISNIEEIVQIFVSLESRNFSLLTYVNQMNREIETLERLQRSRRELQLARRIQAERSEERRHNALADLQKALEASGQVIAEDRRAFREHRELFLQIRPCVLQIAQRIHAELEAMQQAEDGNHTVERLPLELSEENLPQWLEWVEQNLAKFRDLVPAPDDAPAFPVTASAEVKRLAPKKPSAHVQALVKAQELPSAAPFADDSLLGQRRMHATGATHTVKVEIADEDSDDDEFEKGPVLSFKEVRARAQNSIVKKRRRAHMRLNSDARADELTAITAPGGRGTMRLGWHTPGAASPVPDGGKVEHSRGRSSIVSDMTANEDDDGSSHRDAPAPRASSKQQAPPERGAGPKRSSSRGAPRPKRRLQVQFTDRAETREELEVSDLELESAFLHKLSREELEQAASQLGIHLRVLLFLKQKFDLYDKDHRGHIDAHELRSLLQQLGDDSGAEEIDAALEELNADGHGEVEFFEFCSWLTVAE